MMKYTKESSKLEDIKNDINVGTILTLVTLIVRESLANGCSIDSAEDTTSFRTMDEVDFSTLEKVISYVGNN